MGSVSRSSMDNLSRRHSGGDQRLSLAKPALFRARPAMSLKIQKRLHESIRVQCRLNARSSCPITSSRSVRFRTEQLNRSATEDRHVRTALRSRARQPRSPFGLRAAPRSLREGLTHSPLRACSSYGRMARTGHSALHVRPALRLICYHTVIHIEVPMALSARNHLPGTIEEITYDAILCLVIVRVGDHLIESVITRRSAR